MLNIFIKYRIIEAELTSSHCLRNSWRDGRGKPLRNLHDGEHELEDIEGVSPIVVGNVSVILSHRQQPADKCLRGEVVG